MEDERSGISRGKKIAGAFGLKGENWMRHANPASVWTRFGVLPLLAGSVWSRKWIGRRCLIPLALSSVWLFVNPVFFRPPRSTKNWASKAVFGERIWVERDRSELPDQFRSVVPTAASGYPADRPGPARLRAGRTEGHPHCRRGTHRPRRKAVVPRSNGAAVRGNENPRHRVRPSGVLTAA
jgi:hypothetical protein